jgi:signal transduction histidine kinase
MSSFTARITWEFAALVTATTAVVLTVGGWLQSRQATAGLDYLNAAEFEEVRQRLGPEPRGFTPTEVERLVRRHSEIDASQYFFQVRNQSGALLFRSTNLDETVLPENGEPGPRTAEFPSLGRVRVGEFATGDLRVQVASSLEPAERLLREYLRISVLLLLGVALVSVGLGWYFARLTLRSVRAIRETASRIGPDTLGERIPLPAGRDELTALAGLLNQMFDRLEASFAQVRRFTADASHELKTPLALVRLNAEKLRAKVGNDGEADEIVGEILEDLDSLRRVIDSLLFLAKAESGTLAPAMTETDAAEFVQSFAEDARAMAEDRGVGFEIVRADAGRVRCETTLIRQVLVNLLSNAVRVVPAGGKVRLESALAAGEWQLVVTDDGPGLTPEQVGRAFERFVHFEHAGERRESVSGHGLGLAICRSIVTLHGGRIRAENRTERSGLRVVVELPNPGASA